MVKHQKLRAAVQAHVPLEGALGAVNVGEGCPARTGGRTGGHRDASQAEPMGEQFARIDYLAATNSDDSIKGWSFKRVGGVLNWGG